MSEMPNMESSADRVVAALHTVDEKVNAMRDQRLNDPDSFGDKIFKSVVPTLAGLVLGKAFEMVWKKSVGRKAVRADGTSVTRRKTCRSRPCRRYQERGCGSGARHRIRRGFRRFRRARIATVRPRVEGDCGQAARTAGASQVNTSQISQSSLK